MNNISNNANPYAKAFNASMKESYEKLTKEDDKKNDNAQKIDYSSIELNISSESILIYLKIEVVEFSSNNNSAQGILNKILNNNQEALDFLAGKDAFSSNLNKMGYEGKAISELSKGEAQELLDEGGFFSITQTSKRVADFTITLANGDLEALKEGRAGVVEGFDEASKMWGGKLPDISYATQEKTLELIDKRIKDLEETA